MTDLDRLAVLAAQIREAIRDAEAVAAAAMAARPPRAGEATFLDGQIAAYAWFLSMLEDEYPQLREPEEGQ